MTYTDLVFSSGAFVCCFSLAISAGAQPRCSRSSGAVSCFERRRSVLSLSRSRSDRRESRLLCKHYLVSELHFIHIHHVLFCHHCDDVHRVWMICFVLFLFLFLCLFPFRLFVSMTMMPPLDRIHQCRHICWTWIS